MSLGLAVGYLIFTFWYTFSLAPNSHPFSQSSAEMKIMIGSSFDFTKSRSSSPRSVQCPSCPSCRAGCCQPRRGTPQQSWLQLRKYVHQRSISVVLSALWYFIGVVKIYVGYLMAFVIFTQQGRSYSSHTLYGRFPTYTWLGWTRQKWQGWGILPGYDKGSNFLIFRWWDDRWLGPDSPCLQGSLPDNLSTLAHSANNRVYNSVLI